jgi:hypothetical protein
MRPFLSISHKWQKFQHEILFRGSALEQPPVCGRNQGEIFTNTFLTTTVDLTDYIVKKSNLSNEDEERTFPRNSQEPVLIGRA